MKAILLALAIFAIFATFTTTAASPFSGVNATKPTTTSSYGRTTVDFDDALQKSFSSNRPPPVPVTPLNLIGCSKNDRMFIEKWVHNMEVIAVDAFERKPSIYSAVKALFTTTQAEHDAFTQSLSTYDYVSLAPGHKDLLHFLYKIAKMTSAKSFNISSTSDIYKKLRSPGIRPPLKFICDLGADEVLWLCQGFCIGGPDLLLHVPSGTTLVNNTNPGIDTALTIWLAMSAAAKDKVV